MASHQQIQYRAIVVDPLRTLLLAPEEHTILFTRICNSKAWHEWCRGMPLSASPRLFSPPTTPGTPSTPSSPLNALEVYKAIAKEVGRKVTVDQIRECVRACVHDLQVDEEILDALNSVEPKAFDGPNPVRLYLLKTLPAKYWQSVADKPELRGLFAGAFVVGPTDHMDDDLRTGFRSLRMNPREAVFLSSNLLKVFIAKSIGMTGIVAVENRTVVQKLSSLFGEPAELRAMNFLRASAGTLSSQFYPIGRVNGGADAEFRILDNFSQLLIIHALGHIGKSLTFQPALDTCFRFFDEPYGLEALGVDVVSNDIGTTALAHLLLDTPAEAKEEAFELIERQLSGKEIWFLESNGGNHIGLDLVMYANVLRLAFRLGRQKSFDQHMRQIKAVLEQRAYEDINDNNQPQMFLYFLACLIPLNCTAYAILQPAFDGLKAMLIEAVKEQVGQTSDPLALAMIALARQKLGLDSKPFVTLLKRLQCVDGGWEASVYAVHGLTDLRLRNRGVTTAFALAAIEEEERIARVVPRSMISKAGKMVLAWIDDKIPDELKAWVSPLIQKMAEYGGKIGVFVGWTNPFRRLGDLVLNSNHFTLLVFVACMSAVATYYLNLLYYEGYWDISEFSFYQMGTLCSTIFSLCMVYRHGHPRTIWSKSRAKITDVVEDVRMTAAGKVGESLIAVGNTVKEKLTPNPKRRVVIGMPEAENNVAPHSKD